MKVLDLRCANGHAFEGWFASDDDFAAQSAQRQIGCPLCADTSIARTPSAPRLNLSGAREAGPTPSSDPAGAAPSATTTLPAVAELQAAWMKAVRRVIANTQDVGARFPEEARRMHYGEIPHHGIRGQASDVERQALLDEGIEVLPLPMPKSMTEPLQ